MLSKYALVIVDMIKDNVKPGGPGLLDQEATKIIPVIRDMATVFRENDQKVVFACDSFLEGDFIFGGRMKPHAIRGTGGDHPLEELGVEPSDTFLPKRRMSSFYKTDLDQTLRLWGVETVVVCGIVTNVCVLFTAFDAMQNDFRSVIVRDACACHLPEIHEATLNLYEPLILAPLIRIMNASEILEEVKTARNPA